MASEKVSLTLDESATPVAPSAAPPAKRAVPAPPSPPARRDLARAALREPFNLAVLAVLLVAGIALGPVTLAVPLAVAVYAAGVLRSYLDPETTRRLTAAGE